MSWSAAPEPCLLAPAVTNQTSSPVTGLRRASITARGTPPLSRCHWPSLVWVTRSSTSSGTEPRRCSGTTVRGGATPARPIMTSWPASASQPTRATCSQPRRGQPPAPAAYGTGRWYRARSVATSAHSPSRSLLTDSTRSPRSSASPAETAAGRTRPRASSRQVTAIRRRSRGANRDRAGLRPRAAPGARGRDLTDSVIARPSRISRGWLTLSACATARAAASPGRGSGGGTRARS